MSSGASSHIRCAGTRRWATWPPSGGCSVPTGREHAGHLVATSASPSPGSRCGSAKESRAQPPRHSVCAPHHGGPERHGRDGAGHDDRTRLVYDQVTGIHTLAQAPG